MAKHEIKELISADETAKLLGIKKRTLYMWCEKKKIPYYKPSTHLLFDKDELIRDYLLPSRVESNATKDLQALELMKKMGI